MVHVRIDIRIDEDMKNSIRKIVTEGIKYRDLSHFVIVACDKLLREELKAKP